MPDKAAILVDDDHGRQLARGAGRHAKIARHLAAFARISYALRLHAGVIGLDDLGGCLVGFDQRGNAGGSCGRAEERRELAHVGAPVECNVRVFVVEIDHLLCDHRAVGHRRYSLT
jgi:hypothetical protein